MEGRGPGSWVSTTVWVEGREMIFPCPSVSLFPDAPGNVNWNNGSWNDQLATGTLIITKKEKKTLSFVADGNKSLALLWDCVTAWGA